MILIVGVNGAGKTTFIGKFCALLRANGMSVLVGAADTFRAGAIDQLRAWAERTGAEFVGGAQGTDPASVAFDAVDAGVSRGDVVWEIQRDGATARHHGRDEENKPRYRASAGAPMRAAGVDARSARTRFRQARTFPRRAGTGIVVTKTTHRKGGIVVVSRALGVPVKFSASAAGGRPLAFAGAIASEVLEG